MSPEPSNGSYWFTASTSFANPAVTLARSFTDSFSGIQFGDMPAFVLAQIFGTLVAVALAASFFPRALPTDNDPHWPLLIDLSLIDP